MASSIHDAAMPPCEDAACNEPRTNHFALLKAVAVAHEIMKDDAPGRGDSQHGTCDSQRLVAHDQELVRCRRKPTTRRLIHLLKAVEVAHEAPGRQDTMHETRLVAHDDVLVQSWRKAHTSRLAQPLDAAEVARGTLRTSSAASNDAAPTSHTRNATSNPQASGHTILNLPEVLEGADARGHFAGLSVHPLSAQTESGPLRAVHFHPTVRVHTKEAMEAKEGTEAASKSDGDENAPVLLRATSKSDGDESAPVLVRTRSSGIDALSGKPASKAASKDALRGFPSYCGWSYAFA